MLAQKIVSSVKTWKVDSKTRAFITDQVYALFRALTLSYANKVCLTGSLLNSKMDETSVCEFEMEGWKALSFIPELLSQRQSDLNIMYLSYTLFMIATL